MLSISFSNNSINGVWPINDINFYRWNSPHYKYFGQSVRPLTGVKTSQLVSHFDQSSSIITAQNIYNLEIRNSDFTNIRAKKFLDAVILHTQNGIRNLKVIGNKFERIQGITRQMLSTIDVNYLDLYQVKNPLLHFITFQNCTFNKLQIQSSLDPYTDTLIYDNFHGNFPMKQFLISNVTVKNVNYDKSIETDSAKQVISSVLNVASNNITINSLNVTDVNLWQKVDVGSPIKLQIYNFSRFEVERPKIVITNSFFKNISTTLKQVQNVTLNMGSKGGLFTMFHDAISYDILFQNTTFDTIRTNYTFN